MDSQRQQSFRIIRIQSETIIVWSPRRPKNFFQKWVSSKQLVFYFWSHELDSQIEYCSWSAVHNGVGIDSLRILKIVAWNCQNLVQKIHPVLVTNRMGEKCNFRTLHPLRFQIEVRTVLICYVPIRAWKLVSKMLMILNKNPGFGHPNNFYHSAGRIFPVPENIQYFPIFWGSFPRTLLSRFANRNTPKSTKTGVRKDAKMYTTPFVKFQNRNWFIFWIWSSVYEPLRCLKSWSEPLGIGFWKIRDDKLRHFDRVMTYFSGPMGHTIFQNHSKWALSQSLLETSNDGGVWWRRSHSRSRFANRMRCCRIQTTGSNGFYSQMEVSIHLMSPFANSTRCCRIQTTGSNDFYSQIEVSIHLRRPFANSMRCCRIQTTGSNGFYSQMEVSIYLRRPFANRNRCCQKVLLNFIKIFRIFAEIWKYRFLFANGGFNLLEETICE